MELKNKRRLIIGLVVFLLFELAHFWQNFQDKQIEKIINNKELEISQLKEDIYLQNIDLKNYSKLEEKYTNSIRKIVKNYYRADSYLNVGGKDKEIPVYDKVESYIRILEGTNNFDSILEATNVFFELRNEYYKDLPNIWPLYFNELNKISSPFGDRLSPFGNGKIREHEGIDIMSIYQAPVIATADGIVKERWLYHWILGRYVVIEHANGITTHYAHLSKTYVNAGNIIKKGQIIGLLGNTGLSTGPHIHYEIRKNNIPVDPLNYIQGYLTKK